MKIGEPRLYRDGARSRIAAQIVWEDCERQPLEIYYEAAAPFAGDLTCTADVFLAAACIPAMRHGERRVAVAGPVCPELRDGLDVAMQWLHAWDGAASRRPPVIEAELQRVPPPRPSGDRSGCFFTGGVDSMATLCINRLRYSPEHPRSIRDGIIIYGLEVEDRAAFENVLHSLAHVGADTALTLLPVWTNVRELEKDWHFWEFDWEGAVYASVGHALSSRLTSVAISATYDIVNMNRLGSHPLLDPNYGSVNLRVRHEGLTLSRLDKIRLIAGWETGLQRLRVCNQAHAYRADTINCGRCEKCVRTMLGLAAAGALERTRAFGHAELTPELVTQFAKMYSPYMKACYRELVEPLAAQGRSDLAAAVRLAIQRRSGERGWRGSLRRLDRRLFGGRLRHAKRALSTASEPA